MTVSPEFDTGVAGKPARAASDPNGPTGRLATWLANITLNDVPSSVAKHAVSKPSLCMRTRRASTSRVVSPSR